MFSECLKLFSVPWLWRSLRYREKPYVYSDWSEIFNSDFLWKLSILLICLWILISLLPMWTNSFNRSCVCFLYSSNVELFFYFHSLTISNALMCRFGGQLVSWRVWSVVRHSRLYRPEYRYRESHLRNHQYLAQDFLKKFSQQDLSNFVKQSIYFKICDACICYGRW